MIRWLLKQWHRFTLRRTVYAIPATTIIVPGSYAAVGLRVCEAARAAVPAWIDVEVYHRQAEDVPPGVVRIVLETCE